MKKFYSHKEFSHYIRKVVLFMLVILSIGTNKIFAEGTKQLSPKDDDRVHLALNDSKYGMLGRFDGSDTERIYIHIKDSDNEQIMFGFSQFVTSSHNRAGSTKYNIPVWVRIKNPQGQVVWPTDGSSEGQLLKGSDTYTRADDPITSLSQVRVGPILIGGNDGYEAEVFKPESNGDYYIEFRTSSGSNKAIYSEWWDITVASDEASPRAIDGRVFAKQWSLVSPYINTAWYDRPFNGKVYSFAKSESESESESESGSETTGYVTEVDFENSGFRGARFNLAFNSNGTDDTPDFEKNRKSVQNANRLAPEFKIFLNEPDETVYLSADGYGEFIVDEDYPRLFGCTSKYFFRVAVTKKGRIDLLLDLHGSNNKYDPGTSDRIITTLSTPFFNEEDILIQDIPWDGLDGLGNPVSSEGLKSVPCVFDYFLGTFHFPMFDVEHLTNGIVPKTVRPTTPTLYTPKLYWDDSNISESLPDGQLKVDLTGETAPSHNWVDYDYGNENSINTYWHSYSSGVVTTVALKQDRDCALFTPGTISGTVFNDLNSDGEMDEGELPLMGVQVKLYLDSNNNTVLDAGDELKKTFTTQALEPLGYNKELGNFIFNPEIGKKYLVEVSYPSKEITNENPRSYTMYSWGTEYFNQYFGVAPLKVSLSVSESIIQEDDESSEIVVELDYPTLLPVRINLAYGGTAEASDYALSPGNNATNSTLIEIPVGASSGVVTLSSIQDILNESDETVSIDIISAENAVENGEQRKVITIIDGNSPIGDLIDNDSDANSISENVELDDLVHITALATDEDGDNITYELVDDAGGRFRIDANTGVVTVADASLIDFETDESHTITIKATSSDSSTIEESFTIVVTDVDATGGDTDHAITNLIDNDPADNTISENVLTNAPVYITALATDEDGDNITYELVDNAGNRFKIDANTGVVTVADAGLIDFETDESHIIKIKATSSDSSTIEESFTIVVTDVDATGGDTDHAITNLIDNDPADNTISENVLADAPVYITALATDEDGDNITYELVDDVSGRFKIDANTGVVTVADAGLIDFETDESHIITIKATSSDSSTIEESFTIVVTDVDATGGDTDHGITNLIDNDPADNTISENVLVDAPVYITALATDEDGDNITYELVDDAGGRFKIDANTGVVTIADASLIDFETDESHIITIKATSSDSSTIEESFTIVVTDVDATGGDTDHAITNLIDNDPADNTISENVLVDAPVYITALATDEDGDNITYELVDDASGRFKIDANTGVVTVADAGLIDFETDESHIITIKATSSDSSTIEESFTIVVTDVDATGGDTDHAITNLIDNDPADNTISENVLTNAPVYITALATDEDGDNITYELVDDASGRFKIDANTGVVTVADASLIDFEMDESHTIAIKATSSDSSTIEESFTIVVTDVDATGGDTDHAITNLIDNDPADNTISENVLTNAPVYITALATDEDGDNITYELVDDASGRFKIDANTGVVTVADAGLIDFETDESHIITIKATSSDSSTIEESFTIVVTDVDATGGDTDHAITNLIDNDPADNTISENVLADAPVYITALATDEDGDNITYELVDDASGRFKIDANTGVVTVADASLIDFETDESHIITIKATSSDGSSIEEDFTILITDADGDTDHPVSDLIDNEERENVISENVLNDAPVYITAHATDLDDDPITYHLLDDDNGRFKIQELSGVVTVKDESQIDFESNSTHSIRIEARSADGSKISGDFPIFVTDVDGTGGDTDHAITNLIDNDPVDNIISEIEANDSPVHITALATDEDGDAISYYLLDDAGGRFKIDLNTGVVTIANANLIDFEMDESHLIRIEARSSDGSVIADNFMISVTDVDEILKANDDYSQVNEDEILNGENLLSNDYNAPGTSLTINTIPVVNVKYGELVIHLDGTYTYTPELNFNGSDSFVYSVCDDGSPQQCNQATVNITILSVNDAPLAMNDEAQVNEDEILNGSSVLDNDSDIDSDSFEINTSPIKDVEYGSLTINANGTYTYIPDADFSGTDGFIYEICDNETLAACGQATVTISVIPGNDAPRVFDFEMEVEEASLNNPINLESPYDPDGDELSVKILTTVDFGEIVLSNGRILNNNDVISLDDLLSMVFNARERYIGELTMLYEVSDDSGLSAQGRVKITVVPIDVFIPNAITPNNDFLNDKFKIVGLEKFPENSLEIFNRWGNIVYKKRDYDNSWEGYGNVSGQISQDRLPPGTYFYVFKFGVNKKPLSGYVYMTY